MTMLRTQVYFPKDLLDLLKEEAEKEDTTLAHIIRTKVEANIQAAKKKQTKKLSGADFLLKMAEDAERLNANGPKDLATNPDKYLYASE